MYSGTGVVDNGDGLTFTFDPSRVVQGIFGVTYTTGGGCEASAMSSIIVVDGPTASEALINELLPNFEGTAPWQIEFKGAPNTTYAGYFTIINAANEVVQIIPIMKRFNESGVVTVSLPVATEGPVTLVLSDAFPGMLSQVNQLNPDITLTDGAAF